MTTPEQQALWVLRAQCDDREALEALLRSIQPSLRRHLRALVGSDDADDVLQEVLVLIFRKLVLLDDPTLFRPWAFRVASRAASRWLKRHRRWTEDELDPAELQVATAAPVDGELLSAVALDGLSPASRSVVLLHYQEDLPLDEVAAILEIPLGTVKSRLAYGLATLRRRLGAKERS